jgi:hypothetical protein
MLSIYVLVGCRTYNFSVDKVNLIHQLDTMDKSVNCITTKFVLGGGGSETICHNKLKYFLILGANETIDTVFTKNYANVTILLKNNEKHRINLSFIAVNGGKIESIKEHKYGFNPIAIDSIETVRFSISQKSYIKRDFK